MTGVEARLHLVSLARASKIPPFLWLDFETATSGEAATKALNALADWAGHQPAADWTSGFAQAIAALRAEKAEKMAAPVAPDPGADHPQPVAEPEPDPDEVS